MRTRKGQSFLIGAMVFSLLVTLVFLTTGPTVTRSETSTKAFFSQTLDESSNAFNTALEQDQSATHLRRRMQSYDRFVERQALTRGIQYSSYSLIVVPDRGEAAFYSYYSGPMDVSLRINGDWDNRTLASGQGFSTSFRPGTATVHLEIASEGDSYSLDTATPRLVKHSVMETPDETWENTLVG